MHKEEENDKIFELITNKIFEIQKHFLRSSSYASRDASQERKTTTHSLFDNDADEFENSNLQLFSNILSNISGSRHSR